MAEKFSKSSPENKNSSLSDWIISGFGVSMAVALYLWLQIIWHNQPEGNIGDRAVILLFMVCVFGLGGVSMNALLFAASRFIRFLRRPAFQLAPLCFVFVFYFGFSWLTPQGVYYDDWGISSRYAALAIRVGQFALLILIAAASGVAVAFFAGYLRRRIPKALLAFPALALILILAGLSWGFSHERKLYEGPTPRAARPVSTIAVIGYDGMAWRVIDPMIEEGLLPNFARLMSEGSSGYLRTLYPTNSPEIWNTIFSGVPPEEHGILEHVSFRFKGMRTDMCFPHYTGFNQFIGVWLEKVGLMSRQTVRSSMRRRPMLWHVADFVGVPTAAVNLYTTYPAERINGSIISSNFFSAYKMQKREEDFDLNRYKNTIHPFSMLPSLLEAMDREAAGESYGYEERIMRAARMILAEPEPPGVFCVYFHAPDGEQHRYWKYHEPEKYFGVRDKDLEKHKDRIKDQYILKDRMLGEFMSLLPEDSTIIVCSDHGFGPVFGEYKHTGGHTNAPDGIIMIKGPNVKAGQEIKDASVYDIVPTICFLAGIPLSREWPGRVIRDAVLPEFAQANPVREIDGYPFSTESMDSMGEEGQLDEQVNQDMMDQLRALGYIR